jgi:predicted GTPase
VVVVGDGPTLTHGGLATGAGTIAAYRYGATTVVDAGPYAVGSIAETFREFPHLRQEVPAMGYNLEQVADLEATLNRTDAESVVDATPVVLSRLMTLNKPIVNVTYGFRERGDGLTEIIDEFCTTHLDEQK